MTMQPLETQVEVLRAQVERMQREIDALVNMRRLDVPVSSSPQQTARGRMIYDETKDALTVGTGTGRLELSGATDLTAHTADGDAHHDESHAHDGVDGSGTVGHGDLTGVTSDQHHAQSHSHDGVDGSGTVDHGDITGLTDDDHTQYLKEKASGGTAAEVPTHDHSAAGEAGTVSHDDLTGVSSDNHHAQSHGHTGADGSGTVSHANLTGVTSDQHHAQDHASSHSDGGADEVQVEDLATASVDATQVLMPDGLGGVEFAALADGDIPAGIARDSEVTSAISTHAADADAHHNESHAATHVDGGADELDGDTLDIDFTPSNYTPSTSPAEANDVDDLAAHLSGIDTALGSVGGGGATLIAKASDEQVTTSTTLQDDDDFSFSVDANGVYFIEMFLVITSPSASDIKFAWTLPSGGTYDYIISSSAGSTLEGTDIASGTATTVVSTSSNKDVHLAHFKLNIGGTGGTAQLQWAQNTSGGTTTLHANSTMRYQKAS